MTFAPAIVRYGYALGGASARARVVWQAVAAVFSIAAIVLAGRLAVPRVIFCTFGDSTPQEVARSTTTRFALEAFPAWQRAHPASECPESLDPLLEYMNNREAIDPWGRDYRFSCITRPRPTRIVVWSAGPDLHDGSSDDIWSDR